MGAVPRRSHRSAGVPVWTAVAIIARARGYACRVILTGVPGSPYTPRGAVTRSATELASDVDGLRLIQLTMVGDRYRVRVSDDGSVVGCGDKHAMRPRLSRVGPQIVGQVLRCGPGGHVTGRGSSSSARPLAPQGHRACR